MLFFREYLSQKQLIGTRLGLIGFVVLFNPFNFDWGNRTLLIANGFLLLGSLLWSLSILHLRCSKSKAKAFQLAPWQILASTILLTFLSYWVDDPSTGDGSLSFWIICLDLGHSRRLFAFALLMG